MNSGISIIGVLNCLNIVLQVSEALLIIFSLVFFCLPRWFVWPCFQIYLLFLLLCLSAKFIYIIYFLLLLVTQVYFNKHLSVALPNSGCPGCENNDRYLKASYHYPAEGSGNEVRTGDWTLSS